MATVEDFSVRWSLWKELFSSLLSFVGLSTPFNSLFVNSSYLHESAKLLILGSIIETGRRLCQWLIERFRFRRLALTPLLWPFFHNPSCRIFLVGAIR